VLSNKISPKTDQRGIVCTTKWYFILSVEENAGMDQFLTFHMKRKSLCNESTKDEMEEMEQQVRTHRAALDFVWFYKAEVLFKSEQVSKGGTGHSDNIFYRYLVVLTFCLFI